MIKAFRSHPITVRVDAATQALYAVLTLDTGEKILKNIFLRLGGGIVPSVKMIDVYYQDTLDGPILHEEYNPNVE